MEIRVALLLLIRCGAMLSGIRGWNGRFVALAATVATGCALLVACSLNPQPIPPGVAPEGGSLAAPPDQKTTGPTAGMDAGVNDNPTTTVDAGGASPDASQVVDQDSGDGTGDAAADASNDALVEGGD